MSHWTFVLAAYLVAISGTGALLIASLAAMRGSEAEAEKLRDRR